MNAVKENACIILCLMFLVLLSSSNVYSEKVNKSIIKGSLINLPDGKMYLIGRMNKLLDSADTKDGKFEFNRTLIDNEPEYFTLNHKDSESKYRIFTFPTKRMYEGYPVRSQFFMSDSLILIEGDLIKVETATPLPKNFLLVDAPITAGKQTQALFDIDLELEPVQDKSSADVIGKLILKYPSSYHLLTKIVDNKSKYDNAQIVSFLNLFTPEIRNTKSARALLDFSVKRGMSKKDVIEKLQNTQGIREDIIGSNSKLSLVIFWASWCGPCRSEIPELKKLYEEYKSNSLDFVSVSVDDDEKKWLQAVKEEKMPWRQLRAPRDQEDFLKMVFQYNSAIPFIALVDKDYNILLNLTGFSEENNSALLKYLKK